MKLFVIAVMLVIFSFQGAVAAVGSDVATPLEVREIGLFAISASTPNEVDDADVQKVFPSIEQLSDYVANATPVERQQHQVSVPTSLPVFIFSTVLPKIKRPPRSRLNQEA